MHDEIEAVCRALSERDSARDPEIDLFKAGAHAYVATLMPGTSFVGVRGVSVRAGTTDSWNQDGEGNACVNADDGSDYEVRVEVAQEAISAVMRWAGVDGIGNEAMGDVVVGEAAIQVEKAGTEWSAVGTEVADVVEGLAPGIVCLELQPTAHLLGQ